jgi:hypothetical protein
MRMSGAPSSRGSHAPYHPPVCDWPAFDLGDTGGNGGMGIQRRCMIGLSTGSEPGQAGEIDFEVSPG